MDQKPLVETYAPQARNAAGSNQERTFKPSGDTKPPAIDPAPTPPRATSVFSKPSQNKE
jgi:hypothetical protein